MSPIVEPEILLDGEHGIERTFEVAQKVWAEVFFYLAENNVLFEGILLKPSMVTPGAECKERATPQQVADYTLKLLKRRIPPAVPGIMASVFYNHLMNTILHAIQITNRSFYQNSNIYIYGIGSLSQHTINRIVVQRDLCVSRLSPHHVVWCELGYAHANFLGTMDP